MGKSLSFWRIPHPLPPPWRFFRPLPEPFFTTPLPETKTLTHLPRPVTSPMCAGRYNKILPSICPSGVQPATNERALQSVRGIKTVPKKINPIKSIKEKKEQSTPSIHPFLTKCSRSRNAAPPRRSCSSRSSSAAQPPPRPPPKPPPPWGRWRWRRPSEEEEAGWPWRARRTAGCLAAEESCRGDACNSAFFEERLRLSINNIFAHAGKTCLEEARQ